MESYYIWINAEGFGPSQSLLITTINNKDYEINSHLFDNWTAEDVYETGLQHVKLAPKCYSLCTKFSISCQNIRTHKVIAKKTFIWKEK
jgi:hypothetical protein